MPIRDDELDPPPAQDDEIVDAAEDDDEFEDEDEEDDEEDLEEEEGDIETRGALTHEVGSEGGSPGQNTRIARATSSNAQGSEASETMPGHTRARIVERRDATTLIKRAP